MIERVAGLLGETRARSPLVHCLTNPMTGYACANMILAAGAKPIMAEHPREVESITAGADALLLNLGNLSDSRIESMRLSAAVAADRGIPIVLDAVGAGCSGLRRELALELVERFRPAVVKGNRAEIAALGEARDTARGVDAGDGELAADPAGLLRQAQALAGRWDAVVLASGPVDLIADAGGGVLCANGVPLLGELCGTGCMLGALCATYCAGAAPAEAAALAAAVEGVAGELAAAGAAGPGSLLTSLLDAVYNLTEETLRKLAKLSEREGTL